MRKEKRRERQEKRKREREVKRKRERGWGEEKTLVNILVDIPPDEDRSVFQFFFDQTSQSRKYRRGVRVAIGLNIDVRSILE